MSFLTRLAALRARALTSPPSSGADARSHYDHNTSCWAPANNPHTSGRTRCTSITGHACRLPSSMSTCKTAVVPRRRVGDNVVPACSSAVAVRRSLQSVTCAPALDNASVAERPTKDVAELPVGVAERRLPALQDAQHGSGRQYQLPPVDVRTPACARHLPCFRISPS